MRQLMRNLGDLSGLDLTAAERIPLPVRAGFVPPPLDWTAAVRARMARWAGLDGPGADRCPVRLDRGPAGTAHRLA